MHQIRLFEEEEKLSPDPLLPELKSLANLSDSSEILALLKKIDWSFASDKTNYLSHDIHPYPAKFIPQIPCNLINTLTLPGELVWDPYGGSGTTAFEALRLGRRAISTDANPLATEIARAKCLTLSPEQIDKLEELCDRLEALGARPYDAETILKRDYSKIQAFIPQIPNIDKWFHQNAIRELAYILKELRTLDEASEWFARVCFSAIVVRASWQDSETRYSSTPGDIFVGEILSMYSKYMRYALDKHRPIQNLLGYRKGVFATLNLIEAAEVGTIKNVADLQKGSVNLIVTSPPYANTNDYHLYHRFRLFWLGYDPRELAQHEIGSHLRHQRKNEGFDLYAREMAKCLEIIYEYLSPGRFAIFVVGDSIFGGKLIKTSVELGRIVSKIGFDVIGNIERPIHQTKRSFIPAARRAREEKILVLQRRRQKHKVTLIPPHYKLWPYEKNIAVREVESLLGRRNLNKKELPLTLIIDPYSIEFLRRLTFTREIAVNSDYHAETWQTIIEDGNSKDTADKRKDPKYVTHGIHPFKGKFYPQLAKSLFNLANSKNGMSVLDPYCGSGTVLLEAQLNGLNGYGIDLNPLAVLIAKAKTSLPFKDLYVVDKCIAQFLDSTAKDKSKKENLKYFSSDCIDEILSWFPLKVACCIGWLLSEIDRVPIVSVQDGLKVCLSSIIREISQQDPRDLRIRRRKIPLEDAPTLEIFRAKVKELQSRLRNFASQLPYCPYHLGKAVICKGDSRDFSIYEKLGLSENSIDIVITSPPYATALPYIDTDRLSILTILGIPSKIRTPLERTLTGSREITNSERAKIELKIPQAKIDEIGSNSAIKTIQTVFELNQKANVGFRRKNKAALLYRYFRDLFSTLKSVNKVVRKEGQLFFVIGNNKTIAGDKEIIIDTTFALEEMAKALNWQPKDKIHISVVKENYKHSKHSITQNDILWFKSCKKI